MSRGSWAALPRGAMGLSAVCDCGINFPDHTHLLFFMIQRVNINIQIRNYGNS